MRRLGVALVIVASLVQSAYADDLSSKEQDVRQQLAAASAQITQLNLQMAAMQQSAADTQVRIGRERAQVRLLARALYAQPDSVLGLVFQSSSISEAVTRVADLTSAGDRAAATKRALDLDLASQSRQEQSLQGDHDRTVALQKQLQLEFEKLATEIAAQTTPIPAAAPPPLSLAAGTVGQIQQIILNAFAPLGAAGQAWALKVAKCESNYNPYAVNRSSGASGLFQFLPSTWAFTPEHTQSVFDPTANANAAAWLYARDGPSQWQCKG